MKRAAIVFVPATLLPQAIGFKPAEDVALFPDKYFVISRR
jgi:hypothetical protein